MAYVWAALSAAQMVDLTACAEDLLSAVLWVAKSVVPVADMKARQTAFEMDERLVGMTDDSLGVEWAGSSVVRSVEKWGDFEADTKVARWAATTAELMAVSMAGSKAVW